MKRYILLLFILSVFTVYPQHWEWVKQPANMGNNEIRCSAAADGNVYLAASGQYLNNALDCHLIRLNESGNTVWDKNLGNKIQIRGLSTNTVGELFLAGNFIDTIIINGTVLISAGLKDAFLFKFDSLGQTVWFKIFSSNTEDACNDVFISSGDIFITGALGKNAVFEGSVYPMRGMFVSKFDASGNLIQITRSTQGGEGLLIRTDSLNNMYLLGTTQVDTLQLDTNILLPPNYYYPPTFVSKFDNNGTYKGFVKVGYGTMFTLNPSGTFYVAECPSSYYGSILRKYNANCILTWQKNYSAAFRSITTNSGNDIYLTGSQFNYSDSTMSFLWKYDPNGNLMDEVWAKPQQQVTGKILQADENRNIYLIGLGYNTINFGNIQCAMNPGQTYFLAKINGKKPKAGFISIQPYEVQTIYFKNRCFNDTSLKWFFQGGLPAISFQKNPVVSYSVAGTYPATLVAYNGFSSDTVTGQITVKPESPDTIFIKTLDPATWGSGMSSLQTQTSDGGCALVTSGIYKFNNKGNLEWRSLFNLNGGPNSITEVDNGFIILGNTETLLGSNFGVIRPFVAKSDLKGNLLWIKNYKDSTLGNGCSTTAYGLCATDNNGFIYSGSATVKCDSSGNIVWQKIYPFGTNSVLKHSNGKYILGGFNYVNSGQNVFVAQINEDGSINWAKGYDHTQTGGLTLPLVCKNKDLVFFGNGGTPPLQESYLMRLDSLGNVKWAKTFSAGEFWISNITEMGANKIMATGNYGGASVTTRQMVLILIDENGNLEWNRASSPANISMAQGLLSDGNGHAMYFGMKDQNNIVARFNTSASSCLMDSIAITVSNRQVNILPSGTAVNFMHYGTTNFPVEESSLKMPPQPGVECTSYAGPVAGISVNHANKHEDAVVYPNPTSGTFYITLQSQNITKLKVCTVLGEVIYITEFVGGNKVVDLSRHPKGIYFVRVECNNEIYTSKLVIE